MVLRPCADFGGGGGGGGYVDCYPQRNVNGGGHHFYESIKTEVDSFRLLGGDGGGREFPTVAEPLLSCNDDTSSIASKKRIDSMFKTTASSVAGDENRTPPGPATNGRRARSLADDGDYFDYGYSVPAGRDKNTVQEKIEKMFAEISSSELDTDVSIESSAAAAAKGQGASSAIPGGGNKFHVQYIGCAGLSGKISSLEGLQRPVRDMYFGFRENQHQYRRDGERARDFSGLLEISAAGLSIRYRDERGDTVHRTDAFPSIAVWAALKYVCRRRPSSSSPRMRRVHAADYKGDDNDCKGDGNDCKGDDDSGEEGGDGAPYEYAFLPLIADPDGSDKAPLFRDLDAGDRARLDAAGDHAPVFAVVMRCKPDGGRPRPLECHGFACETENDALLMAANLYGALVAAMQSSVEQTGRAVAGGGGDGDDDDDDDDDGDGDQTAGRGRQRQQQQQHMQQQQQRPSSPRRYIRHRNGFTSMSSTAGSSVAGDDVAGGFSSSVPPALPPPRPPRRNKKSASSVASSTAGDDDGPATAFDGDVCGDAKTFRMTVRQPPSLRRGVCNSGSAAITDDVVASASSKTAENGGDILTKVAIPRSRSFLHSNGLASGRYSRRAAGCGIETAADRHRRRSNGSSGVMGFSDMFNELRVQEGLNNMDEILNAIINVEGMSYNDLKPIYREFLTKLSVTMTKDELYQRTKAIMEEQKRRRNNNRRPAVACLSAASAAKTRGRRLNDKLRRALNLRAAGSRLGAVLLPDFCRRADDRNRKARKKPQKRRRCACSKALPTAAAAATGGRKLQRRASGRRALAAAALKGRRPFVTSSVCSTSDESEFFAAAAAVAIRKRHDQLKQQQLQHAQHQLQKQLQQQSQPYLRKSKKRGSGGGSKCSGGGCLHRASSGYFSCSECSAGAADDKCYCAGATTAEPASLVSCSCDSDSCADSDKCYCGRARRRRPRNIFDELKSRGFAASESSVSRADSPGTAWKKNELMMAPHSAAGRSSASPVATVGTGAKCGVESSKSIEYLQMTRRRPSVASQSQQLRHDDDVDDRHHHQHHQQQQHHHYSSVMAKKDRMSVYGVPSSLDSSATTNATSAAAGCSSPSPSSSLSAATVYSSSSAVAGVPRPQRQRRSGSSGSDNFRAIDYALFATNGRGKSRGGREHAHRRSGRRSPAVVAAATVLPSTMANRRSYSSEAVHLTGCHVYHHHHQQQQHHHHLQQRPPSQYRHQPVQAAARRHSVHDGGAADVLSSFFKSDIENSLGYYP